MSSTPPASAPAPLPALFERDREDALAHAADAGVDIVVVGGGITGAGVALDAVTRGFRVVLIERDDLASGTSSKSSKLVHGGVRYLAQADLAMVAEGVRERDRLHRLAPHLVRPLGFVVPVDDASEVWQLRAGMTLYDGLAAGRNVKRHRRLTISDVLDVAPGLQSGFREGGFRYYDAQTDDARLALQVARTARRYGADVVNHVEVTEVVVTDGRVRGVRVRDRLDTGADELEIRCSWVVSAAGVWAAEVLDRAPTGPEVAVTPAIGVHLSFSRRDLPVDQAVVIPSGADDGRRNFVIPWGDQVYTGTTDEAFQGELDRPGLASTGAAYLLHGINEAFGASLTADDAVGAWAGLRPLLSTPGGGPTADLSRRHAIVDGPDGMITVTGGKLTTYRQMAEDAVDRIVAAEGRRAPCSTRTIDLGARGRAQDGLARTRLVCDEVGVDPDLAGSLYHRHGDDAATVAAFCVRHGESDRLVPELPYLVGEIRWAARRELARTLDDVLQRRLRVSVRHAAAGGPAIHRAADILKDEFSWDAGRREHEVGLYLDAVRDERGPVPVDRSWVSIG